MAVSFADLFAHTPQPPERRRLASFDDVDPYAPRPDTPRAVEVLEQGQWPTVRAEATPYVHYTRGERNQLRHAEDWQTRVNRYDREGPGIVGAALDIPSSTATHVRLVVQLADDDWRWNTTDDPVLNMILAGWRGRTEPQAELVRRLVRSNDGPGECYQIQRRDPVTKRWYVEIRHSSNLTPLPNGLVAVRTRPNAGPGSRWYYEVEDRYVTHLYLEDPEWPGMPWSPQRRALEPLELYRKAARNIGRNIDSQLAMNGMIWAKASTGGNSWMQSVHAWVHRAISSDDGLEAGSPYLLSTVEKPEWIDVGRGDHADQLSVAAFALAEYAQISDIPTQWLQDGPGTANHWGDQAQKDHYADHTMYPRLSRLSMQVECAHLKPWMSTLRMADQYDPAKVRVWFDDADIRGRTDNTELVFRACDKGIATRQALADRIGLEPDEIVQIPDAIQEWELQLIQRGDRTILPKEAVTSSGEVDARGRITPAGNRGLDPGDATAPATPPVADNLPALTASADPLDDWDELTPG